MSTGTQTQRDLFAAEDRLSEIVGRLRDQDRILVSDPEFRRARREVRRLREQLRGEDTSDPFAGVDS